MNIQQASDEQLVAYKKQLESRLEQLKDRKDDGSWMYNPAEQREKARGRLRMVEIEMTRRGLVP